MFFRLDVSFIKKLARDIIIAKTKIGFAIRFKPIPQNRKRRLEKFVDLCVVNKTCISLTTVTEKNSFTTKLAYDVNETGNPLTSCDKRRRVFCPGKWRLFRTKRTIWADSSGKTGIFPDDNGKSERNCEAPQMANMASQLSAAPVHENTAFRG